jgi:hypothetical protein
MKKHLFFDQINVDGPKKKLLEFNNEINLLNENELKILDDLLDMLKNKQFYHSSKLHKLGYDLVKKLFRFPADKIFPVLDIYRMFLMHPGSSENYKVFENALEFIGTFISYLRDESLNETTKMLVLRCFANLFNNNASKYVAL